MANVTGFKDSLAALTELLPRVPAALAEVAEAQALLTEAAEQFLHTIELRQAEAADLFPRMEVSLAGLGREAADGTAAIEQHRDVASLLEDPALAFEDRLGVVLVSFLEKQRRLVQEKVAAVQAADQRGDVLDSLRQSLRDGLTAGRQQVVTSVDTALGATQGLQGVVEVARTTVSTDVERLGTEIDTQHTAQARELEGLRRDVATYEAAFVERIERVRDVVRQEGDRMIESTRDRVDDMTSTLSRALLRLRDGLRELDERLHEAAEEGEDGRQSLGPYFTNLENKLPQLRQAIEHVREAAATVGIPF